MKVLLLKFANIFITVLVCIFIIVIPEPDKYKFILLVLVFTNLYIFIKEYKHGVIKIELQPKQRENLIETAKKQNKSVDQFCLEAINEKLDKNL